MRSIFRLLFNAGAYPGKHKMIRMRAQKYFRKAHRYNVRAARIIERYEALLLEVSGQAAKRDARHLEENV
jgi:hypothetical protein